ncbi:cell division protein ZapA [Geotalea sp. SG265]|uniref:cell division protein ZapA n=1 Tax=Geotalea sp. SG265 TaxID=2922867 RepID=UPI001FAF242E|nr:cell division protein ZapA [Geotalea sp. SG265]
MSASHRIVVLGQEINVRSTADESTVHRIESFVAGKVAQVLEAGSTGDNHLAIILTLLNLAEDYLVLLDRIEKEQKSDDLRIAGLLERLSVLAD